VAAAGMGLAIIANGSFAIPAPMTATLEILFGFSLVSLLVLSWETLSAKRQMTAMPTNGFFIYEWVVLAQRSFPLLN